MHIITVFLMIKITEKCTILAFQSRAIMLQKRFLKADLRKLENASSSCTVVAHFTQNHMIKVSNPVAGMVTEKNGKNMSIP